jgi:mRNA-degrading endonuclease RelE of RelBE toxin-antitoxin system
MKQVRISDEFHKKLKKIAFDNDVFLEDLLKEIIENALNSPDILEKLVKRCEKHTSS